ncbi:MAG: hypothetical protein IJX26_03930 [Clostridia bacterium]|nr:hypothetical protein [Clostridia bacterium]
MEKAKEKSINLLKLLNNCKDKLHALYNLCVTNVLTAKTSNEELDKIYDEASTKQADLKGIMTALVTSHKDNRAQNGKASQGVVKQIKASLSNLEIRFYELYDSIVNDRSMEDSKALYKQYKGEVSSCCEAYKLMNENSKFADI